EGRPSLAAGDPAFGASLVETAERRLLFGHRSLVGGDAVELGLGASQLLFRLPSHRRAAALVFEVVDTALGVVARGECLVALRAQAAHIGLHLLAALELALQLCELPLLGGHPLSA